jgi:hypothetical protein
VQTIKIINKEADVMNKLKGKDFSANDSNSALSTIEQYLLHLKIAFQKFVLSIGKSINSPYAGVQGTWQEQLEQLRWRYKLRSVDVHRVKESWLTDATLLPQWCQNALKRKQLYLLAYVPSRNAHSAVYMGTAMLMAAQTSSSGIEADEGLSGWCRRSGFQVTGGRLNYFLDERVVTRVASASSNTRYLLTDQPLTH